MIHGGTYREAVIVEASGTAQNPIIFEAAPGEHVLVTGADLIADWRREDDAQQIHSTPWPYRFIDWSRTHAHPGDDRHLLIGRCEQVFAEHYPLRQVLTPMRLLARMNATYRMVLFGALPLGAFLAGLLGSVFGLWHAMEISALALTTPMLWLAFSPVFRLTEIPAGPDADQNGSAS